MFGHRSDLQLLWLAEGLGQSPSSLWERDSQVTFWSWRMIPASASTELLHQSKGMKLSPAFENHFTAVVGSQNPQMASVQPRSSSPLERLQQRETWVTDQGLQDKAQPQLCC